MDRVRIGFIGAGGIASRHIGNLLDFPDVLIVAVSDPFVERAEAQAARAGARAYTDYRAMLDSERLDALYICTPPFAHGAPEHGAIERRLPFFVEKPIAADLDTGEAIGRAVAACGLVTAVGYHWRYLDIVEEAAEHLAASPAQLVSGYWLDATPPPAWWRSEARSGGQIVEQATHILDLARLLVGEAASVFAWTAHMPRPEFPECDIATATTASLRFASGAIGNLGATCLLQWPHRIGLHLFCEGLALELSEFDMTINAGRDRPARRSQSDPFVREDRSFIEAVKGGPNPVRAPYGEALETHRLAVAVARSAREGRPVDLIPAERTHE